MLHHLAERFLHIIINISDRILINLVLNWKSRLINHGPLCMAERPWLYAYYVIYKALYCAPYTIIAVQLYIHGGRPSPVPCWAKGDDHDRQTSTDPRGLLVLNSSGPVGPSQPSVSGTTTTMIERGRIICIPFAAEPSWCTARTPWFIIAHDGWPSNAPHATVHRRGSAFLLLHRARSIMLIMQNMDGRDGGEEHALSKPYAYMGVRACRSLAIQHTAKGWSTEDPCSYYKGLARSCSL